MDVWNVKGLKKAACLVMGLAAFGLADNPISTYHYLADPGAAADDEYFYIITDSDDPAPYNSNGYKIYALYAFRSKDSMHSAVRICRTGLTTALFTMPAR